MCIFPAPKLLLSLFVLNVILQKYHMKWWQQVFKFRYVVCKNYFPLFKDGCVVYLPLRCKLCSSRPGDRLTTNYIPRSWPCANIRSGPLFLSCSYLDQFSFLSLWCHCSITLEVTMIKRGNFLLSRSVWGSNVGTISCVHNCRQAIEIW